MNPKLDADSLRISVAESAIPWPSEGVRRASVQSFGFGGANSHVVLDDARSFRQAHGLGASQSVMPSKENSDTRRYQNRSAIEGCPDSVSSKLLVWSSDDEAGITRLKQVWKEYFDSLNSRQYDRYMSDLAYTLSCRRSHLRWRYYAVVEDTDALTGLLDKMTEQVRSNVNPKACFIFTGQGSQWFSMGRELIYRYEVFRSSLKEAGAYFQSLGSEWNILGMFPTFYYRSYPLIPFLRIFRCFSLLFVLFQFC